jgi:hypothetical protein
MHDLSLIKRAYYRYLSMAYAFTYYTSVRTFLGASLRGWIHFLALALLAGALILGWGQVMVGITAVLLGWVYFSYWRAKKAGYSHFVADTTMSVDTTMPDGDLTSLPPNQKVKSWATGIFSVTDQDDFVLLRPAEYWQVPLRDHVIMVELQSKSPRFRYQFFNGETLQRVQKGWLLFGSHPRDTLAITLLSEFGPEFESKQISQFMASKENSKKKGIQRTVYLSFATEEERNLVWHNIVRDARSWRQQGT